MSNDTQRLAGQVTGSEKGKRLMCSGHQNEVTMTGAQRTEGRGHSGPESKSAGVIPCWTQSKPQDVRAGQVYLGEWGL